MSQRAGGGNGWGGAVLTRCGSQSACEETSKNPSSSTSERGLSVAGRRAFRPLQSGFWHKRKNES